MADELIASRYAQAAFETAKEAKELEPVLQQLLRLGELLRDHTELRELLFNPDVDPPDKLGIVERLLKGGCSDLVRSFLQVVLTRGRAEVLPAIIEAFRQKVDDDAGRLAVTVRSAHPLPAATLSRLRKLLEQRERKAIVLTAAVEPGLLGGLQILLDHRIADGSVRRQLADLKERLHAVKVV